MPSPRRYAGLFRYPPRPLPLPLPPAPCRVQTLLCPWASPDLPLHLVPGPASLHSSRVDHCGRANVSGEALLHETLRGRLRTVCDRALMLPHLAMMHAACPVPLVLRAHARRSSRPATSTPWAACTACCARSLAALCRLWLRSRRTWSAVGPPYCPTRQRWQALLTLSLPTLSRSHVLPFPRSRSRGPDS